MSRAERRRARRESSTWILVGERVSISETIKTLYETGAPQVLTAAATRHLQAELGSSEAAVGWLVQLIRNGPRPIGVNLAQPDGSSTTVFLPPDGWTRERLAGYVGTLGAELEAAFGEVTTILEGGHA